MRAALAEFLAHVRSIERTIELRDHLVEFGRVPPRQLNPTAAALRQSVRQIGVSGMQPNLDGSVLLVAAAFEQFVSDLIIAFAGDMPVKFPAYEDLPRAIRSANERLTGEALSRRRFSRFTAYQLQRFVSNLDNCLAGTAPYVLNGEAIALNDRNLNSATLRDLIRRLGVDNIWTVVASTRNLQNWSGRGGARTANSRAQNQLNELIDNRNQIAHRVGSTTLGPQVIRSYIRFVRVLTRSLVKGLEDYVGSL